MKFKTQYNYDEKIDTHPQTGFEASQTIPDESLTIREILARFSSGEEFDISDRPGDYPDVEPDFDDVIVDLSQDMLDILDSRADLEQDIRTRIEIDKDNLSKAELKKIKEQEEKEASLIAKLSELVEKKSSNSSPVDIPDDEGGAV